MDIAKMLLDMLEEEKQNKSDYVEHIIRKLNFSIASKLVHYDLVDKLNADSKKFEACFKSYIVGVLIGDKDLRIKAKVELKQLAEGCDELFKNFRKFVKEHKECLNNCKQED